MRTALGSVFRTAVHTVVLAPASTCFDPPIFVLVRLSCPAEATQEEREAEREAAAALQVEIEEARETVSGIVLVLLFVYGLELPTLL